MFFSVNAFHTTALTNKVVIANRVYDKVNLMGNGVFDAVHLRKRVLSEQEVLDIETKEIYGIDSIFVANFEGNLEAGNYTSLSKPISKWRVRRKKVGSFTPNLLKDLDVSNTSYIDYLQANRTSYEYQISPVSSDGTEGVPLLTITESDFFGWFLCSIDNQTVYKFDMSIESESIALNMDRKLFEGFTKYPVTRTGKRKYHSGGLKTMPYKFHKGGIYEWYALPYSVAHNRTDNDLLREVEDFISNGEPKILKNTSGDLFKVQTSEFSYQYMDVYDEQPYTIDFKWTQVGDGE